MKKNIKIAISGRSGCGNTTVSKMVSDELGLSFINFTFRSLAQERNLDLKKMLELAAKDDSIDKELDNRQVQLAMETGGCVLGSRLAIWMLKEADLKVYLDATPKTRAARIVNREGGNLDEIAAFTADRDRQDHGRYLRIYNIDTDDYSFADLVIETDNINPQQITEIIINRAKMIHTEAQRHGGHGIN
ncbi:MAG: AAA family ATPase [Treponema sp.]|nr:AAA family ATPase [Treponema sp.]